MPRTVSSIVYWILNSVVWTLWLLGLDVVRGTANPLALTACYYPIAFFLIEPIRLVLAERKASRKEGRPPLTLYAIADRPVALRLAPTGLDILRNGARDLALILLVVVAVSYLFGERTFHFFPLGLPLLASSAFARLFVREEGVCSLPTRRRSRGYGTDSLN